MGGKRSKKVVIKKAPRPRPDTIFTCPFCNEEASVECKIDRAKSTAFASCRSCGAGYHTVINCECAFRFIISHRHLDLTEATDIYHEWVDAVEDQK